MPGKDAKGLLMIDANGQYSLQIFRHPTGFSQYVMTYSLITRSSIGKASAAHKLIIIALAFISCLTAVAILPLEASTCTRVLYLLKPSSIGLTATWVF
jgi:hypothetical protein